MHLSLFKTFSKLLGISIPWLAFWCFGTSKNDVIGTSSLLFLLNLLVFKKFKAFAAEALIETFEKFYPLIYLAHLQNTS